MLYPRNNSLTWEQNLIYKNFKNYISDNNISCNVYKKKNESKIDTNIDFVITFGIFSSKESVLMKYNIHGIQGINFDSSSINHYRFVTLNSIRPPEGLYIGFVQEQLE